MSPGAPAGSGRGWFVTFEGLDGCGKSTQIRLLADRLTRLGRPPVVTVEPGGTAIGLKIREILLDRVHQHLAPRAELLLYFASRAQNVAERIAPALERGEIVLSDRFTDSTLAYQGYGRGLGPEAVRAIDRIATGGLRPDATVLLDIDEQTSFARSMARSEGGEANNRMDEQPAGFYRKVRQAFLAIAREEPERILVIDAGGSIEAVAEAVWEALRPKLGF